MTKPVSSGPPVGRPLKFDNAKHLRKRIEAYFRECDRQEDTRVFKHPGWKIQEYPEIVRNKQIMRQEIICQNCCRELHTNGCVLVSGELKLRKPYTATGLAVWLDTSRQTLINYECRPDFFDTIKRAKQRIENYAEEKLFDKDFPTKGVSFSLSNNSDGWAEKIETTVKDERDPAEELADGLLDAAAAKDDTAGDAPPSRSDDSPAGNPAGEGAGAVPEVLSAGVQDDAVPYQIRVARALLASILVRPGDVYVKIARQLGKTEVLTLLFKFLIIFYLPFLKRHLMAGIASPKGKQAKTDIDRIKKSIQHLRERWKLEDRENNAATVRAYRKEKLTCEMYKFSLAPTTDNESKTLNVLAVEESHKANHAKRRDQLDPMLGSTGGVTWHFGVGCPGLSDYKTGCDGAFPDSVAIIVPVDEVCRDRRVVYEQTGEPMHLGYERKFLSELEKYGRQNPRSTGTTTSKTRSRKVTSSPASASRVAPTPA